MSPKKGSEPAPPPPGAFGTTSADVTPANSSPWLLMPIRRLGCHLQTSRLRPLNPPGPPGATQPLPRAQPAPWPTFPPTRKPPGTAPPGRPTLRQLGRLQSEPHGPPTLASCFPGLRAGTLLTLPLTWPGGPGRCSYGAFASSPTQNLRCGGERDRQRPRVRRGAQRDPVTWPGPGPPGPQLGPPTPGS